MADERPALAGGVDVRPKWSDSASWAAFIESRRLDFPDRPPDALQIADSIMGFEGLPPLPLTGWGRMVRRVLVGHPVTADGCVIWSGQTHKGYGFIRSGRRHRVHRVSYALFVGALPYEDVIDHLCCEKLCVNPRHLDPTTLVENIKRGSRPHFHLRGRSAS